jgi:hypothetical protein
VALFQWNPSRVREPLSGQVGPLNKAFNTGRYQRKYLALSPEIKALPTMTVFTSIEELDDYLDKVQRKGKDE